MQSAKPQPPPSVDNPADRGAAAPALRARKKYHARIEHKVRGRIRMKIPHGWVNPEILETYRQTFLSIPGVRTISIKPESGSLVIHYDPSREQEFERHFEQRSNDHLEMVGSTPPEDKINKLVGKIEAEAEFLAAHSRVARTTVDFFKAFDRELKLSTSNLVDLKVLLAGGLAAYTFLEIGGKAATPMWVTLALFSLNHFVELQTDHRAEFARVQGSG